METRKVITPEILKTLIDQNLVPWDKRLVPILGRFDPNWSFVQKTRHARYWESVKLVKIDFEILDDGYPSIQIPPEEEMRNIDVFLVEMVRNACSSIFFDIPATVWSGKSGEIRLVNEWALDLNLNFIVPEVQQKRRRGRWDNDPGSLRNRFKALSDKSRPEEIRDTSWATFQRWLEGISQERLGIEKGVTSVSIRSVISRILLRMERRERNAKMVQVQQTGH